LRTYPETPSAWRDQALAAKWDKVREIRRVVTGALELARADKKIGASLQAHPVVHLTDDRRAMLDGVDLGEISITSAITVSAASAANGAFTLAEVPGVAVLVNPAEGGKCERCWQVLPEVGGHPRHPTLCNRCADVVGAA
ncbi:MAG: zinc finger domain-containing protein, partial [Dongiaceae bacterium]